MQYIAKNSRILKLIENLFFYCCIILIPIFPHINIPGLSFHLDISDILCPIAVIFILINNYVRHNIKPIIAIAIASAYILITIFINGQQKILNNYFEIYDILKLLVFFLFFKGHLHNLPKGDKVLPTIIDTTFIILLVFNLFHLFNIFYFNETIMPIYCGYDSCHLIGFGHNSIGGPAPKRLLGTLGNPNNNAILFLFFLIYYSPQKKWSKHNIIYFFLALIPFFCCQSRTSIVAFIIMIIVNYIFIRIKLSKMLLQVISIISVAVILNISLTLESKYYESLNPLDPDNPLMQDGFMIEGESMDYTISLFDGRAIKSNSFNERLKIWSELINMWKQKPLFGHSPNKNFFYDNHIYAENEYVLVLWRYGILGLLAYLIFYIIPIYKCHKQWQSNYARLLTLTIIILAISALMNCPMSNTKLSVIAILFYAAFYSDDKSYSAEKNMTNEYKTDIS